jgi:tRNA pseudouridine55 synthase
MVGRVTQRPPRYSALKIDGERLHQRARAGRDDEAQVAEQLRSKQREVQIDEIRIEDLRLPAATAPDERDDDTLPELTLFVRCGKGTYIRSIARDLGEHLDVGGHLTALRRLRVGRFTLDLATGLLPAPDRFDGPPRLFTPAQALDHLPAMTLPEELAARLRNGQKAALSTLQDQVRAGLGSLPGEGQALAALDPAGELAAVVVVEEGRLVIGRGFVAS